MSNVVAQILPGCRVRMSTVEPSLPAPAAEIGVAAGDISLTPTCPGTPASPVRMTIGGQPVGIFASPQLAEQTKRLLTR